MPKTFLDLLAEADVLLRGDCYACTFGPGCRTCPRFAGCIASRLDACPADLVERSARMREALERIAAGCSLGVDAAGMFVQGWEVARAALHAEGGDHA